MTQVRTVEETVRGALNGVQIPPGYQGLISSVVGALEDRQLRQADYLREVAAEQNLDPNIVRAALVEVGMMQPVAIVREPEPEPSSDRTTQVLDRIDTMMLELSSLRDEISPRTEG